MPASNVQRVDTWPTSGTTVSDDITISDGSSILIGVGVNAVGRTITATISGGVGLAIPMTEEVDYSTYETRRHFASPRLPAGTYTITATHTGAASTSRLMLLAEVPGRILIASPGKVTTHVGAGALSPSTDNLDLLYNGDVTLVAIAWNQAGGFPGSWTLPSGFTSAYNSNEAVCYKEVSGAAGTQSATFTATYSGSSGATAAMFAFTDDDDATSEAIAPSVDFPLSASADNRSIKDISSNQFIVRNRCAWGMWTLNETYRQAFLDDTVRRGFNTIQFMAPQPPIVLNGANARITTPSGELPFTARLGGGTWVPAYPYTTPSTDAADFASVNEDFFDELKAIIDEAAARNLAVILTPMFLGAGGNCWAIDLGENGTTKAYNYGAYLGTKFAACDNVFWILAGDYTPDPSEYTVIHSFIDGLKSTAPATLYGAHWSPPSYASEITEFADDITVNMSYSYDTLLEVTRDAYTADHGPVFEIETNYEPYLTDGQPQGLRMHNWGSVLNCCAGFTYGHMSLFGDTSTEICYTYLSTQGSREVKALNTRLLSTPLQRMNPSGLGGMATLVTANVGTIDTTSYVSAAAATAGDQLLAYLAPAAGNPTLDLSVMARNGDYTWLDPADGSVEATGTFTAASGQSFTKPGGTNAAGGTDWVLLLTASLKGIPALRPLARLSAHFR